MVILILKFMAEKRKEMLPFLQHHVYGLKSYKGVQPPVSKGFTRIDEAVVKHKSSTLLKAQFLNIFLRWEVLKNWIAIMLVFTAK